MTRTRWQELIDQLRGGEYQFGVVTQPPTLHQIEFDPGLTDAEVEQIETRFGFRFPPDLREFLQTALPRGPQFPNWRSGDPKKLAAWLDVPREGILFDIEHNGFWLEDWGPSPTSLPEALRRADELIAAAPRLIPIYAHRFMPDEPNMTGNPVFSVHQADIILYGTDLEDYFRHEFGVGEDAPSMLHVREIRFWNLDRFQEVRWSDGPCVFDNSIGVFQ